MKQICVMMALLCFSVQTLGAQTAPTASEIARFSPLFSAAHSGTADDVRAAFVAGGTVEERDAKSRLATHIAGFASNEGALRALAEAGADMNALEYQLYDVVTIAAVANDPATVKLAIELGNRTDLITSVYVGTALVAAAHLGHHEVVDILVQSGAPLDHVNNLGWTALMEAVVLGDGGPDHVKTAQVLVQAGADRSIADHSGLTPLEHAERRGYAEMVRVLRADQP